jgi:hypothetical protein
VRYNRDRLVRQLWNHPLQVVLHRKTRDHQLDPVTEQVAGIAAIERLPEVRVPFTEQTVTGMSEHRLTAGARVESLLLIAEIAMQLRPQREVIMRYDQYRQIQLQHVQTVPDHRTDQHSGHAKLGHDPLHDLAVAWVRKAGTADRRYQRPTSQRQAARQQAQFQRLAVAPARPAATRPQAEIDSAVIGTGQILSETLDAAAPFVQHVQDHRPPIEAWIAVAVLGPGWRPAGTQLGQQIKGR